MCTVCVYARRRYALAYTPTANLRDMYANANSTFIHMCTCPFGDTLNHADSSLPPLGNACMLVCVCAYVTGPLSQRKINSSQACLQSVFVPLSCVKQREIIWNEQSLALRYSITAQLSLLGCSVATNTAHR